MQKFTDPTYTVKFGNLNPMCRFSCAETWNYGVIWWWYRCQTITHGLVVRLQNNTDSWAQSRPLLYSQLPNSQLASHSIASHKSGSNGSTSGVTSEYSDKGQEKFLSARIRGRYWERGKAGSAVCWRSTTNEQVPSSMIMTVDVIHILITPIQRNWPSQKCLRFFFLLLVDRLVTFSSGSSLQIIPRQETLKNSPRTTNSPLWRLLN